MGGCLGLRFLRDFYSHLDANGPLLRGLCAIRHEQLERLHAGARQNVAIQISGQRSL